MEFTGEFFIPNKTEKRIQDDHYARYEFAKKFITGKRVLDIACGVGYGSKILGYLYNNYTGVDINAESIKSAQVVYKHDKVKYICSDICNFKDEPFDAIICFETIEHVSIYKEALLKLFDNLNNNGILIISSPNRNITSPNAKTLQDKPANKYHTQEFIPEELIGELIKVGFSNKNIEIYGQRQEFPIKNSLIKDIYYRLFNPTLKSSPKVKPISYKIPRYFILVAKKIG
jgi:cyclopropane fatty-acyl-phospholipid synthase-like methyltransferase